MNQVIIYRERVKRPLISKKLTLSSFIEGLKEVKWWEYLLMFFLLSISGNPYIQVQNFQYFITLSLIIPIVHLIRNYKKSISYRTIFIFVFLLGYEVMHAVIYKLDYTLTIFKLGLTLLLSAATVDILKDRFVKVLIKTMVIISLMSFAFVFISYSPLHKPFYLLAEKLFPIDKNYEGQSTPTLIIYTFCRECFYGDVSYIRNAGIFWESGAFAVFLNITLFLHYSTKTIKSVKDLFDTDSTILIIALASTTSTMGSISLMMVLTSFSFQLKSVLKYVLLVLIVITSVFAFTNVEFLGKKISSELKTAKSSNNRFGSALKDFENIAERPLLGWSRRLEVLFNTSVSNSKTHRPNGFTNFLRNYGLIYFSVYFFLVFSSFKNIYKYHHSSYNFYVPLFGVFLLFIVSFSEVIFDLTFLKSLVFLFPAYQPIIHTAPLSQKQNGIYSQGSLFLRPSKG